MNEAEALAKMIPPGQRRPAKTYREGVLQIWTTSSCDKNCFGCTQLGQVRSPKRFITVDQFALAIQSLGFKPGDGAKLVGNSADSYLPGTYFGVVGTFGANPVLNPHFDELCEVLREYVPYVQRGLWCNNLLGHGAVCRKTFNPAVSNLNCHMDKRAYDEFRETWPEGQVFGLDRDSRHSPPWVAMQDVNIGVEDIVTQQGVIPGKALAQFNASVDPRKRKLTEGERWTLKAGCDINQYWSAMIGVFRGELRGYFCEIAGAQAIAHQDEEDYPDHGLAVYDGWWREPMTAFAEQARFHCDACGVPLRGHGELACSEDGKEQVSETHAGIFRPKRSTRRVEVVTDLVQLGAPLAKMTDYIGNSAR